MNSLIREPRHSLLDNAARCLYNRQKVRIDNIKQVVAFRQPGEFVPNSLASMKGGIKPEKEVLDMFGPVWRFEESVDLMPELQRSSGK